MRNYTVANVTEANAAICGTYKFTVHQPVCNEFGRHVIESHPALTMADVLDQFSGEEVQGLSIYIDTKTVDIWLSEEKDERG